MAEAKSTERSVEVRVGQTGNTNQVAVERGAAEGLPPGWIKEVRIQKKGGRIRRDPYYTDPQSGCVFRSLKDAVRYLKTGEIGRYAIRPKDNGNEAEVKPSSAGSSMDHKPDISETVEPIPDQITLSSQMVKDEQVDSHPRKREQITEHTPDRCTTKCNQSRSSPPDCNQPKLGGFKDIEESNSDYPIQVKSSSDVKSSERRVTRSQSRRTQSKLEEIKEVPLRQRSSKRLSGIALEPNPDMNTIKRTHRNMVEQSNEVVAAELEGGPHRGTVTPKASLLSDCIKAVPSLGTPEKIEIPTESKKDEQPVYGLAENVKDIGNKNEVTKECRITSSVDDLAVKGVNLREIESDGNETTSGPPLDLPLEDLWKDPCIAFAIRTLTGASLDDPPITEDKSAELARDVAGGNKPHEQHPLTALPQGIQGKGPEINSEKAESPYEGIWNDPCIEFAIKTLTGTIPFDCDVSLSQVTGESSSQGDYLSRQHEIPGRIVMENSSGARCQQQDHERRNGCHL